MIKIETEAYVVTIVDVNCYNPCRVVGVFPDLESIQTYPLFKEFDQVQDLTELPYHYEISIKNRCTITISRHNFTVKG